MKGNAAYRLISAVVVASMIVGGVAAASPQLVAAGEGELRVSSATDFVYLMQGQEGAATYVAPPADQYLRAQAVSIVVEYVGFTPEARAAFQYAVNIWQGLLSSPVPITVVASWEPLPAGILGGARPVNWRRNFPGAPVADTWYPLALANKLGGRDFDPDMRDINIVFNSALSTWYFGTGLTPTGRDNFASTVLHELAHGFGFSGTATVDGGIGYWGGKGDPEIYDRYVLNGSGQFILDTSRFPNPSAALAAQLQGQSLWFNGREARAANGGNPPRLFAPYPWLKGSSYSHLDEFTYPTGSPNSLMTPGLEPGETVYHPGPIALGMLADLGWTIASAPPPAPSPAPSAPPPSPPPSAPPGGGAPACFNQTGKCVPPLFMAYWEAHGGLAINGYPLSDARLERLEDGKDYFVQYFERVRMELHPENAPPNDVLLGQFGRLIHPADPPVAQAPGQGYFPQTGHNVPPDFLAYWEANGGLPQFGFPLSEVVSETLENGQRYQVQYFERARFERHPEYAPPNQILLGQFGRRILEGKAAPSPSPSPSPSPGGNVIFRDNFTDPNSGWPVGRHPQGHYETSYLPGEYRIALAAANYYAILTNRNIPPQANVRLEADMTRFGPIQEPLFGFACRVTDRDNYYGAVIDTTGNALVFKIAGGMFTPLAQARNHPAIQRGNATNRVRFDCVGAQLTLYVNGTPVAGAQDGQFGSGQQGFLVYAFDQGGLDLHIRDFVALRP